MTVQVLYAGDPDRWSEYAGPLRAAFAEAGVDAELLQEAEAPQTIDYLVYAPNGQVQDFTPFSGAKAVLNLWAGVEDVVGNPTLSQPLARMVDPGLSEGMVEWVTGHVLRHHLGMDRHIKGQDGNWRAGAPPLARDRHVTVLGLGALGEACARSLAALNFRVSGWSQSPKSIEGVEALCGSGGLETALRRAEILVLLLPLTERTENLLDAERLAMLPEGAVLINPGRGPLIDDDALLAALDSGALSHATLDVFREEPLPAYHAFWAHPQVTVTPHIASETRAASAARVIAENIRRGEAGEPLLHLVDREAGY